MRSKTSAEVLGIIPARGGSKGIPKKNLQHLRGEPLINFTIQAARQSHSLNRFIVSTDDEEIAEYARQVGAEVPFLRPQELAQDHSLDIEFFQHALEWLRVNENYGPDAVVHLRPTTPLRKPEDIDRAVALLFETGADTIKSVCIVHDHPHKMWKLKEDDSLIPYLDTPFWREVGPDYPRQKLEPLYVSAGLVDVVRTEVLLRGSTVGSDVRGYVVDSDVAVDIDTTQDIYLAEKIMEIQIQN